MELSQIWNTKYNITMNCYGKNYGWEFSVVRIQEFNSMTGLTNFAVLQIKITTLKDQPQVGTRIFLEGNGAREFFDHTFTENNTVWNSDKIPDKLLPEEILCQIQVSNQTNKDFFQNTYDLVGLKNSRYEEYKDLFEDEVSTDITFVVKNRTIKAHKLIVGARSPVLKEMFKEKKESIDMNDFDYDTVLNFKKFIYLNEHEFKWSDVDKLLHIAEKFKVKSLINVCSIELIQNINAANAFDALTLLDRYKKEEIKEKAMDYITKNKWQVLIHKEKREKFQKENSLLAAELYFHIIVADSRAYTNILPQAPALEGNLQ